MLLFYSIEAKEYTLCSIDQAYACKVTWIVTVYIV